ncbi:dual specificity protein phosphatase 9 [Chrysemys picta bellii]|uniref:dual specificity protein phosphatase 9 n=1 Tax=Chrysemys picta bellii TaxID=8478 RepID=UPI0032B2AB3E
MVFGPPPKALRAWPCQGCCCDGCARGSCRSGRCSRPRRALSCCYDEATATLPRPGRDDEESVLATLLRKLREEGCTAYYLQGGFSKFQSEWPDHCETSPEVPGASSSPAPTGTPVVGLGGLSWVRRGLGTPEQRGGWTRRQPAPRPTRCRSCPTSTWAAPETQPTWRRWPGWASATSSTSPQPAQPLRGAGRLPLQADPHLGPLEPEPSPLLPEAIAFIDEAVSQNCGILVHCLAGVSRSVTVTVAYLMQRLNLSLNDAYDLVKRKKADISPTSTSWGSCWTLRGNWGWLRDRQRPPEPLTARPDAHVSPGCFFTPPASEYEEEDGSFQRYPT